MIESLGKHIVADLWGVDIPDSVESLRTNLFDAIDQAGAQILGSKFHVLDPNNGMTGVILLAESHLSIHTWPEHDYVALDIFMCGNSMVSIDETFQFIIRALKPARFSSKNLERGSMSMTDLTENE